MLAVNFGVAGQGQPDGRFDPRSAEQVGPVALGREREVRVACFFHAPVGIQMRIDSPPGARAKRRRQQVAKAIVDVEIQVEPLPGNGLQLAGPEMHGLDESFQGAATVHPRGIGPCLVVEDHRNTTNRHEPDSTQNCSRVAAVSFQGTGSFTLTRSVSEAAWLWWSAATPRGADAGHPRHRLRLCRCHRVPWGKIPILPLLGRPVTTLECCRTTFRMARRLWWSLGRSRWAYGPR